MKRKADVKSAPDLLKDIGVEFLNSGAALEEFPGCLEGRFDRVFVDLGPVSEDTVADKFIDGAAGPADDCFHIGIPGSDDLGEFIGVHRF